MSQQTEFKPVITSNISIPPLNIIAQHAGDTHSLSLISMAMLDPNYKSLYITTKYANNMLARQALEHVIGIWMNYKPIKTRVRSMLMRTEEGDNYLDAAYGIKFGEVVVLDTVQKFEGYKVVIDIVCDSKGSDAKYVCNVYRELENGFRTFSIEYTNDS